jgi:hypothetical protein
MVDLRVDLSNYFHNIKQNLHLDPASEKEIILELKTHVEDESTEMQKAGLSEAEAIEKSIHLLGSAKLVAQQIYDVHSQGNWKQALLAAMPHVFFAVLFALNWLTGVTWVPILLVVVAGILFYGLSRSKPTWLFPWLGYALFPVAAAGVCLLYLPEGWTLVTLGLYIPLVIWLFCFITIKFIRRDWLYATLMLIPVPTFVGWFMAAEEAIYPDLKLSFLYNFAPWSALTFLMLGVASAMFTRLKKRWLRIAALSTSGVVPAVIIILTSNRLGFAAFVSLSVLMVSFVLVPVIVEHSMRHGESPVTA